MSAAPMLVAEGLQAAYGPSQILFGVNLQVSEGQVVGLLGRNGAGKSTTFKALMGLLPPRGGQVLVHGDRVDGRPPHVIAQLGLGYVPEDRQVFTRHTVQENLEIAAKRGADGRVFWTLDRIYEKFPILAALQNRLAGRLSGGEQQILTIARTLMGNPSVLLLDEPSEGLAPIIVNQIANVLLELRQLGLTVLLAEQNMNFCLRVATNISIIEKGLIVYEGDVEEFKANDDVKKRYLSA